MADGRNGDTLPTMVIVDEPVQGAADGGATPPPRPRGSPSWAMLATAALLGGLAAAGLLAVTGLVGSRKSSSVTTVVQHITSNGAGGTAAGLDARALYTAAAAGVVDVTARVPPTGAGPFGEPSSGGETASGTGFLIDSAGHVVTAAHVVDDALSISVRFQDGTTRPAKLLGKDDAADVAVLKADTSGLTVSPLRLGSSASLAVGDPIAAVGDPFAFERSISTGVVSGLDRTIEAPNGFEVAHAIQTDAALNPGNSGGPVLDRAGRVVGLVDQIATSGSSEQSSGVGFAVPVDVLAAELGALERGQKVRHPYLGVATESSTSGTAGALIQHVAASGPAKRAGLRVGDIVTTIDGTRLAGSSDLVAAVAAHKPGEKLTLIVRRGNTTKRFTITLGTQPETSLTTTG